MESLEDWKRRALAAEASAEHHVSAESSVLDHLMVGYLEVDRELIVRPHYSKICHTFFGRQTIAETPIADVFKLYSPQERMQFELGFEQVFDDLLPEQLTLAQLPKLLTVGIRVLAVSARVIRDSRRNALAVAMTIVDRTQQVKSEQQNLKHTQLIGILRQREAFGEFLHDCREILIELQKPAIDPEYARRAVHTIKGNAASFGLTGVVKACHLVETQDQFRPDQIAAIGQALQRFTKINASVLGISYKSAAARGFRVSAKQIKKLTTLLEKHTNPAVAEWVQAVSRQPIRELLGPLPALVKHLADRSGKKIRFKLVGGEVVVDSERFRPIVRNLTHALRNAVYHGIEAPWARGDKRKTGLIELKIVDTVEEWIVTLADDGAGIDGPQLVQRARASGRLDAKRAGLLTKEQSADLIFEDGVSTANTISFEAGRGVGLSSLRGAVHGAGGAIHVSSVWGRSTTLLIRVPKRRSDIVTRRPSSGRLRPCASS